MRSLLSREFLKNGGKPLCAHAKLSTDGFEESGESVVRTAASRRC
jgi:hypothetical protein